MFERDDDDPTPYERERDAKSSLFDRCQKLREQVKAQKKLINYYRTLDETDNLFHKDDLRAWIKQIEKEIKVMDDENFQNKLFEIPHRKR